MPAFISRRQPLRNTADPRRAGLRRMRTIATLLLALMTVVFVLSAITKLDWPWLPYVRTFSEAGMIGACADWSAVVALFRWPGGHSNADPAHRYRRQ
jgi:uncharacterized membrane-anchored protein YjiN (DUF445 family)